MAFFDGGAKWTMGGKAVIWATDRDGKKPLAFQGAREVDVYAMFFDQELYDRFKLNKDDFSLLKEKEENEKKEKKDTALQAAISKKEKAKCHYKKTGCRTETKSIEITNEYSFHFQQS